MQRTTHTVKGLLFKALTISEYPLYISHLKCFNPPVIFIDMT